MKVPKLGIGIAAGLVLIACAVAYYPVGKKEAPPAGYAPMRDDALAAAYLPVFDCPPEFGPVLAVYYRAAKDASGIIHLAYHPVWARERNDAKAWGPFISRCLYTGGLSLQRAMYGKGDIESVGLAVDPSKGEVLEADYETAADYNPASFGVKHLNVVRKGPLAPPLWFKVVSWNHLFSLEEGGLTASAPQGSGPALSYFTDKLWNDYAMWKNPETVLRKDRAHFVWERGFVQQ
jgi:hypothetical protein